MAAQLTSEQLARAVYLQRRLWTQERIAVDLGVSQSTVSRALSRHNRRAMKRLEARTAAIKAQQVAQLEYLAEEAANEWHRSKLDAETTKTTEEPVGAVTDGSVRGVTKTETTLKGQTGDPSLLREVRGALADIRKILGLDAPPPKHEGDDDGLTGDDLIRDMEKSAELYEQDEADESGTATEGTEEVQ